MEIGDEHPILERICDSCADCSIAELQARNPKMALKYEATKKKNERREKVVATP